MKAKFQITFFAVISCVLASLFLQAQDNIKPDRPPTPVSNAAFMRAKLVGSQQVLDGLVSEDFRLILRGAESMKSMSQTVQWPQSDDAVYQHYSEDFQRHCDSLASSARQGKLEQAHYTYLQMTTQCINCHNYVRKRFKIERPDEPSGPIRLIPTEWKGQTYRSDKTTDRQPETRHR